MNLKIKNGILLKPYAVPWREDGYRRPPSWTPDPDDPWIKRRCLEIQATALAAVDDALLTPELVFQQAGREHGTHLQSLRKPWHGWVPVNAARDKNLSRAYRKLFIRLNPEHKDPEHQAKLRGGREKVLWPPDGDYTYVNGRMEADVSVQQVWGDIQQPVPLELSPEDAPGGDDQGGK